MVDEELIEDSELAKVALSMLSTSGVLLAQIDRIMHNLVQGDGDEPVAEVTAKILTARRQITNLRTLQELGESYTKGVES